MMIGLVPKTEAKHGWVGLLEQYPWAKHFLEEKTRWVICENQAAVEWYLDDRRPPTLKSENSRVFLVERRIPNRWDIMTPTGWESVEGGVQ